MKSVNNTNKKRLLFIIRWALYFSLNLLVQFERFWSNCVKSFFVLSSSKFPSESNFLLANVKGTRRKSKNLWTILTLKNMYEFLYRNI